MNMEEYLCALENHVASHKLNLRDGESDLSLLYEAYSEKNRLYNDQIKADFAKLYQLLNQMPLREMDLMKYTFCILTKTCHGGFSSKRRKDSVHPKGVFL